MGSLAADGFHGNAEKEGFPHKALHHGHTTLSATELVLGLQGTKITLEEGSFHEYHSVGVKRKVILALPLFSTSKEAVFFRSSVYTKS